VKAGRRRDPQRARDIVDAIERIDRWHALQAAPLAEDFYGELGDMYRAAVMRELAVIGEAASALSDRFLSEHPELPWRQIRGFRDRVVHEHWDTDWAIIEEIVTTSLPELQRVAGPSAAPPKEPPPSFSDAARRPPWGAPVPAVAPGPSCGVWMPLARARCALRPGHAGHHRSAR
jgi:uncharacterized protein with HEPN domain